jgi:hypothetical protein
MGAIFSIVAAHTGFDAEYICIGAVRAFSQGKANPGNRYLASAAKNKQVVALCIVLAILSAFNFFYRAI